MKLTIKLCVFILISINVFASNVQVQELVAISLEEKSMPADIILSHAESNTFGIYDAKSGSINFYNINGRLINSISKPYLGGGNCFVEYGDKYLYCNNKDKSLDIIDKNLNVFQKVVLPKNIKGKFDPTDVIVLGNSLYIVDNDNHRILKYSFESKQFEIIGKFGENNGEFWYPYSIAFDSSKTLFVSETLGTRIQKIRPDNSFGGVIGGWGINPGQFYRPTGIALLNDNLLFVADGYLGHIQLIDSSGKFAGVLMDSKNRPLKLGSITHIRIKDNFLGVIDAWNKKVYIYKILGSLK